MSKYRFKNREEFIRDGLWDEEENCPYYWNSEGEMNKYLGKDVPDECVVYCDKNEEFKYDGWLFQNTDYVLKEQQEYFDNLSQHIGRYIKALVDNPHSGSKVKKGDIGKIITRCQVDFPNRKSYSCTCALSKDYLGVKYELLPEDYSPEKENKEPNIEFIPGKWYKYNGWYIKYKEHVDDIWRSSEQINYSKKYSKIESRFGDRDSDDKKILLVDLSEIQEYLPDGHPDKITSDVFKKGEYIVLIGKGQSTGSATLLEDFRAFIQNHCYKVRENNTFLMAELDSSESTTNGWVCIPYSPNQFHKTRNWRYATQEEIDEYERRGKPYDVTELNKQSFPDEGSIEIEYIPKNLMSYLENNNRKSVSGDSSYNKEKVVIAWNKSSFWFCSVESSKPKYSKDFIEKIIGKSIYLNTILEAKKELSMEEIQEECKERFPIGCTFIPVGSSNSKILKKDSYTYSIVGKQIWAHFGGGCLYEDRKWAELVSLPKENITEIPEYVECFIPYGKAILGKVYKTTDENEAGRLFGLSWKQVLVDFSRLKDGSFKISNKEAYEKQKSHVPEYIECTETREYYFIKGNIYKVIDSSNLSSARLVSNLDLCGLKAGTSLVCSMEFNGKKHWKPSTKEAYEQQKSLSYEAVSGCFPTDKKMLIYDEVGQYPSISSDYWEEIPKFEEQNFDIYGPTPDIE